MLTDLQCKAATCPADKPRARYADSGGLYLEVSAAGSKRWFYKYRKPGGAETRLALGSYPDTGIKAAREARDRAKVQRADGADPLAARKAAKGPAARAQGETFRTVAERWLGLKSPNWSGHHRIRERRNLDKDLLPFIGDRPMGELLPPDLLACLRRVEERGTNDVAHRVLITARGVWAEGIASGATTTDATSLLHKVLQPHHKKNFAAITDPAELGKLLRVIKGYQGGLVVRTALQLAPMLFQRPGELRGLTWGEVDLDAAMWSIASARMKRSVNAKATGAPHLVPLPRQAVALLRELKPLTDTGKPGALCFPGERGWSKPISDNTLRAALQTLGYSSEVQTVHGFRASARTMLVEQLGVAEDVVEAQLAHVTGTKLGTSYDRVQHMAARTEMMQRWADYLDQISAAP